MRRLGFIAALVAAGAAAAQEATQEATPVVLPSGLEARLQEVLRQPADGGAPVLRFRFVAPGLDRSVPFETIAADLEHLCTEIALARAPEAEAEGARIVVSLGDKPSRYGVPAPDVTQVFEAYRVQDGRCIWEVF